MATKDAKDPEDNEAQAEEAKPSRNAALIAHAEGLLHPPSGGYDEARENFNLGVQAVIALLKAEG